MNDTIFVPEIIKVGYNKRKDTYTGKLAYIIYFDQKGKLRKEQSWESWRNETIEPEEFKNEPISGFVINKKVGDYISDWNHRMAYVRIYDPRNFEFEITVQNLLYILENTSSIKGKGLDGEFVYGWDGKDLILMPTSSPDYVNISTYTKMLTNPEKFKGADLILGATYKTNTNETCIYLGRFTDYSNIDKPVKKYFFYNYKPYYLLLASLSNRILQLVDSTPVDNYGDLLDELEHHSIYSPVDFTNYKFIPHTVNEVENVINSVRTHSRMFFYEQSINSFIELHWWNARVSYTYNVTQIERLQTDIPSNDKMYNIKSNLMAKINNDVNNLTIDEIIDKYKPSKIELYLLNGNVYKKGSY